MKKILSIICLFTVVLTAASCKKETVVVPNNNITRIKTVQPTAWTTYQGNALTTDIDLPELTDDYNENGAVLVYVAYGDNAPWEQLPETFDGQAFSFTHNPGTVSLYVQNPNGVGLPATPSPMYVKIVLIESRN
ncbi:hypothetical protein [Mucilaginibacter phyllosphaerae]